MNNLTEILGQYKTAAGTNTDIKTRFILEQPSTLNVESNLFFDVSQDAQFVAEKENATNYRFYGNISPIINKLAYNKVINQNDSTKTDLIPINIDNTVLDFNNDNWSVVLMTTTDFKGSKGIKQLNNGKINYSISNGLPALAYKPTVVGNDNTNKGFLMYLGHNFSVNDTIYISTTSATEFIKNGFYNVSSISGDIIFIDEDYSIVYPTIDNSVYTPINNFAESTANAVFTGDIKINNPDDVHKNSKKLPNNYQINNSKMNLVINNVELGDFDETAISDFMNERPSFYKTVTPTIFVRKVSNNEILEYYVKQGTVLAVLDNFDNCAFSLTPFGLKNKNYVFNDLIDLTNMVDHLNYPVNNLYIGIIKNGATNNQDFTSVESNFSQLIEHTNDGDGFELIAKKSQTKYPNKPRVGQNFYISLSEYSTETLTETDITHFNHKFLLNDVLFYYNPFTKIPVKLLSSYINVGDNTTTIPKYGIYSKMQENYIWKTFYDIGQSDENGNIIEFPFLNNSFYVFNDIKLFLNIEKNKTLKYDLNVNDLTSNGLLNNLLDNFKTLNDSFNLGDTTDNTYKKFNNILC